LTTSNVRSLACPAGKREEVYWDTSLAGFGLRVQDSGARAYVVQYAISRHQRRKQTLDFAAFDFGKARETAKQILAKAALGGDPAREKQEGRAQAAVTVGALLAYFLDRQRQRLKPRSLEETERHLLTHAKPLHATPIIKLDRRMIAARLGEIDRASGPAAANRVRTSLSAFCTWAARQGYIDSNPVSFTDKAVENGARERLLKAAELAAIWSGLGDGQYGTILKLLLLTGARREEIGGLRWSEIDFDAGEITLPPARTKNKREQLIPMSAHVTAILKALPRRTDPDGNVRDLVFGTGEGGFSDWSGSKQELDARITAARGKPLAHWTPHDFRRLLSTTMHEQLRVSPAVVEAILGHVGVYKAGVRGVYNKALYLDERRRGLTKWAEHIEGIIRGKRPGKVVKLRR
jgi:integrase